MTSAARLITLAHFVKDFLVCFGEEIIKNVDCWDFDVNI